MSTDEGRYSKVSRRIWNDRKFLSLSAPKPNARDLFLRLITGPENTSIPGAFQAWNAGLASSLGWPISAFERCLKELTDSGLVKVDPRAGFFWIPKSIHHNIPTSPNVVASWRAVVKELPECDLLTEALAEIEKYLTEELGEAWLAAWDMSKRVEPRPAKVPTDVREKVQSRDGDHCRYCAALVNWKDRRGPLAATYDHIDPAGPSTFDNLVVSCRSCNSRKGFRTPEQARMKLRSEPGKDLGKSKSETKVPSTNQDQEQEQEQEQEDHSSKTAPLPRPVHPQTEADIPCPADLELTDEEFAQIAIGTGITREFVDRATPQLRARWFSSGPRTLDKWRRTLVRALTASWGDSKQRDELLGKAPPRQARGGPRRGPGPVQPSYGSAESDLVDMGYSPEDAHALAQ